ncbi:MAG: FliM/FliN family flagellar motor C-terminal domain-containing protein [Bdellovibrionota bacterium]
MNEEQDQLFRTMSDLPWGDSLLRDLFAPIEGTALQPPDHVPSEAPRACAEPRPLSTTQCALLGSIQLELRIDVGQLQLSIAELLDLAPGQIFRSPIDRSQPLVLRIGENEIARARLVKEGEALLLEIISVVEADCSEQLNDVSRKESVSERCAQQTATGAMNHA